MIPIDGGQNLAPIPVLPDQSLFKRTEKEKEIEDEKDSLIIKETVLALKMDIDRPVSDYLRRASMVYKDTHFTFLDDRMGTQYFPQILTLRLPEKDLQVSGLLVSYQRGDQQGVGLVLPDGSCHPLIDYDKREATSFGGHLSREFTLSTHSLPVGALQKQYEIFAGASQDKTLSLKNKDAIRGEAGSISVKTESLGDGSSLSVAYDTLVSDYYLLSDDQQKLTHFRNQDYQRHWRALEEKIDGLNRSLGSKLVTVDGQSLKI